MEPRISWKIFAVVCVLAVFFAAFIFMQSKYSVVDVCFKAPRGGPYADCIRADVADDPLTQELGLSGRPSLSEGSGMLFVFSEENRFGFWMKDMLVSLDIIWLDENKTIIFIKRDLSPCSPARCPSYGPPTYAKYVIEVPANYTLRHNISNGTQVFF